jgi:hypothetical protein
VRAYAELEYLFARQLGEHGAHGHLSLVQQRDLQELTARLAGAVEIYGPLSFELALDRTWTVEPYASWPVGTRTAARAALEARFSHWAASLDAGVPLTPSRSFDLLLRARVGYRF